MAHIIFFFNFFAFSTGIFSIFMSLLFFKRYKKRVILYFSAILLALSSILLSFTLKNLYFQIADYESVEIIHKIAWLFDNIGCILIIYFSPLFFHYLYYNKVSTKIKIFFRIISLHYVAAFLLDFFIKNNTTSLIWSLTDLPILFGTIIYSLLFGLTNISKIGDQFLKKSLLIFLYISLLYLGIDIIYTIFKSSPQGVRIPLFMLTFNILCLVFSFKYFNQPVYFNKNHLTDYFTQKFGISKREREIISLVLQGESNDLIKEKLFISIKTVESHLYSCYKKTGVKNRIQLMNLIQSNSN